MIKLLLLIVPPVLTAISAWLNHGWGIVPLVTGVVSLAIAVAVYVAPSGFFPKAWSFKIPVVFFRRRNYTTEDMTEFDRNLVAEARALDEIDQTAGHELIFIPLDIEQSPELSTTLTSEPRTCFSCGGRLVPTMFPYTMRTNTGFARSREVLPGHKCTQCLTEYMRPALAERFATAVEAVIPALTTT